MARKRSCVRGVSGTKNIWPWVIGGVVVAFFVVPAALAAVGIFAFKDIAEDMNNQTPPLGR